MSTTPSAAAAVAAEASAPLQAVPAEQQAPIPPTDIDAEAGPSQQRAPASVIDKWLKPDGPPRDVSFGARKLGEADDVWSNNAW